MFKLVVVAGNIRGQEFILKDGENVIGRSSVECDVTLPVDGVSKKHMRISVSNDAAFLEDMGSSNGTFLNGKIIKRATINDKDKIALPGLILQVVYVKEKKVIIKQKVTKIASGQGEEFEYKEGPPKSLGGKMIYAFKHKIMPIIYGFNEQYDWSVLLGILLAIFVAIVIGLTIFPVLRESKKLLVTETALRGKQYADEVVRANSVALSRGELDKIDTNFLESSEGVYSYEMFDLEGRIVRPIGKLNSYISESFSVDSLKYFKDEKNRSRTFISSEGEGQIGIARAIKAYNIKTGREEIVGVIAIIFAPQSLLVEAANNSKAYLESLVTASIIAILFFGIIYFMTTRHLDEMRLQIEAVLRGKKSELESTLQFKELNPLRASVNSLLQRVKELQNVEGAEMQELEDDSSYVRSLYEFMQGAQGPVMILNSEKTIQHLNLEAEDLIGLRENSSAGQSLLDTARDQGFAATVIDLCDQSASNDGVNQKENYEISGIDIAVNVCSLIGKDKFAKAFYVTFVRDE